MPSAREGLNALLAAAEGRPAAMVAVARQVSNAGDAAEAAAICTRALALDGCTPETIAQARELITTSVPKWHFSIVRDTVRNDAYEAALARAVTTRSRVLEIGTGTGILSMMAARAGAAHVITCEMNPAVAAAAREVIAANGLSDRITVVQKHSDDLDVEADLGGPADVLVSEIVSNDLLGEGALPVMEKVVPRLLKPGAAVIPVRGQVRIALAEDPGAARRSMGTISGFDLSAFNQLQRSVHHGRNGPGRTILRSQVHDLFSFDFGSGGPYRSGRTRLALESTGGRVNGVVRWIGLDLDDAVRYENIPQEGGFSCWAHLFTPLDEPVDTAPGDTVTIGARHDRTHVTIWVETPGPGAG